VWLSSQTFTQYDQGTGPNPLHHTRKSKQATDATTVDKFAHYKHKVITNQAQSSKSSEEHRSNE
jgi:hypothetical protein